MKKTHILLLSVHASINMYIYVYVDLSPNLYFSALFAISPNPVPAVQPSPVALKALEVHPFPKMEAREPPLSASALLTVQPSHSLFLPIFL